MADKPKDKKSSAFSYKVIGNGCAPLPTNPRGDGVKIKGTGAATKGKRARGPMG